MTYIDKTQIVGANERLYRIFSDARTFGEVLYLASAYKPSGDRQYAIHFGKDGITRAAAERFARHLEMSLLQGQNWFPENGTLYIN